MSPPLPHPVPALLHAPLHVPLPAPQAADTRELVHARAGRLRGVAARRHACAQLRRYDSRLPSLGAPLGARAVLVFGVPASALAQPWAVISGNTLSALVGAACGRWLPLPAMALAAVSMALARGRRRPVGAELVQPVSAQGHLRIAGTEARIAGIPTQSRPRESLELP